MGVDGDELVHHWSLGFFAQPPLKPGMATATARFKLGLSPNQARVLQSPSEQICNTTRNDDEVKP